MLVSVAALVFAALAGPASSATLINCPSAGSGVDPISRAFFIPNYPGVSLQDVTLGISSNMAQSYVLTLTAHVDAFDGAVLGSATSRVFSSGDAASPTPTTFSFSPALSVAKGRTIAFVMREQGTNLAEQYGYPSSLFFGTGPAGACGAVETNDSSPPLSQVRGSVPVTVAGDIAPLSLVPNSTFDTGVSGWTVSPLSTAPGMVAFDSSDASGSQFSGSALLTVGTGGATPGFLLVQGCAEDVRPGVYSWGGKTRYTDPKAGASVQLAVSDAPDCSALQQLTTYPSGPADGAWHSTGFGFYTVAIGSSTRSIALLLSVERTVGGGTASQASFDDLYLRPTRLSTLTVPGAASIHGQAGSFFRTDLWVLNRSFTEDVFVGAEFRCFAGRDCGTNSVGFPLAPREQRLFPDVLTSGFSAHETAGAIDLSWDSSLGSVISATARTYSPAPPAPGIGTGIPALRPDQARARAVFVGLVPVGGGPGPGGDPGLGSRSNLGVYNPSSTSGTATFTLFDDSGAKIGSVTRAFVGFEAFQINDIFGAVGSPDVSGRSTLVVTSTVPIFSFVTVIDNRTNDPSFLLPTSDELAP